MLPDISEFMLMRTQDDAPFEGVPVPGLRASYFHRDEDGRTATVGCYFLGDREILRAWGYADEEHCRHNAVRGRDGWHPAADGCPEVELIRDGQAAVIGLAVRAPNGEWVRAPRPGPAAGQSAATPR
ncbi:hypothetical protein Ato02nite_040860 [Paractinoplanes toevensis]|uniref:Uncharacterized protein n=2 Tax=Paractinoplanes toevensis TaxID=571911 RepID=A0A919TBD2_9ACTN|nr:hypothetical protein Ato02nite_040860 [Actinoplanes toevensis]